MGGELYGWMADWEFMAWSVLSMGLGFLVGGGILWLYDYLSTKAAAPS